MFENNKIYIGYTSETPEKRFSTHWAGRNQNETSILHNAMKKYGKEQFIVEPVEEIPEELWSEREKYWIEYYQSKTPKGYNIQDGGNKPPIHFGSKNCKSKLTDTQVEELIYDLQNYTMDFSGLCKKYGLYESTIEKINKGEIRHREDLNYPLRKIKYDQYIIQQIIQDLKEGVLSQGEIEIKYKIKSRTRLYNINNGKVGNKLFPQEKYPIRESIVNRVPTYLKPVETIPG